MALRQHKVRSKPGPPELITIAFVLLAVATMTAGPLLAPGTDWRQVPGNVIEVYRYQHASSPDGRPHRLRVTYEFNVGGVAVTGRWEGEWPEAHSPNALPEDQRDRLAERGYPLQVFYDPLDPGRSTLHQTGNRAPVWWLRLSIGLALLVLWYVFVVYPKWKRP